MKITFRLVMASVLAGAVLFSAAHAAGDYGTILNYALPLTLTAPNGGESWKRNSRQYIRWTASAGLGNLRITLWQNSTQIGIIADNVNPAAGAYSWNVGTYSGGVAPLGTGYSIRIREKGTDVIDASDGPFSIVKISVKTPNGGESWPCCTTQNITWTAKSVSGSLRIVLFKDGVKVGNIVNSISPSAGSYSWSVGSYVGGTAAAGTGYQVQVREIGTDAGDRSDTSFTLTDPTGVVTFTYSLDAGQIDSLPAGADHVRVVFDGQESTVPIASRIEDFAGRAAPVGNNSLTVSFETSPGDHSYTADALSGSTVIATIGPITMTKVDCIPVTIPLAFGFPAFDTYQTDVGTDAEDTLIYFGTPDPDRIVQYGGGANDLISVSMDAGNDWSEQYGEEGDDDILAVTGTGNDYASQDGAAGDDNLQVTSGDGDDWIHQKGGDGVDAINCQAGDGNDRLYQEGEAGNDLIAATTGYGDDTVTIDAGSGNDIITFDAGPGTDTVLIDGGDGTDAVTINENGKSFTIKDNGGNIIYQTAAAGATTIAVQNIEVITVLDQNGMPLFTWTSSYFATSKTDTGTTGEDNLISFGTSGRDFINQFGGGANDLLSVEMGTEADWVVQYGGGDEDTLVADAGTGNDYVSQKGGDGNDNMTILGGNDDDWIIQEGDFGDDTLNALGGEGNDQIFQLGSDGNDTIHMDTGYGNDTAVIHAGTGNDTITFDAASGTDTVLIDGGDGTDTLTVNKNGLPVIVKDSNGTIIYDGGAGGTIITVKNVETVNVP
jgi:hypothetical protein